jgi:hypothetical protein
VFPVKLQPKVEAEAEFESLFEDSVLGGTGRWPVAAGYQPAAHFGGKLPPKTGW